MSEKLLDSTSEYKILEGLKKGDEKAISCIFDRYSKALFAAIKGRISDTKKAEDILQNTFVYCIQNIQNYPDSNQTLFTWMLCSCIKNCTTANETEIIKQGNEIHTPDKIVVGIEMRTISANKEEGERKLKNLLELLCLKGWSLKKVSEELKMTEEELKVNLRSELIKYRKTKVK